MNIEREESQIKVQDAAEREKNISNARLAAIASCTSTAMAVKNWEAAY